MSLISLSTALGGDLRLMVRGRESVLLCLAAMMLFAASDIVAKYLSLTLHPLQIAWFRYLAAAILLVVVWVRQGGAVRSAAPMAQVMRGLGMAGSTLLLIASLSLQPVVEATALVFISPCIVTVLCVLILKERVPPWRWVGVFGGLIGVLILLRPGFASYNPASLLSIASAACWAVALVMTRRAVVADTLVTTLAYSALTGFILLSAALPFVFQAAPPAQLVLGVATAVLWLGAHVAIAFAYRRPEAQVSRLAPISYTHLLWATGFGYLVFGTIPDGVTIAGAAFIIASGLLAGRGERQSA